MWDFHRTLTQAGFEHAQTSPENFLAELEGFKGAMNPKHFQDVRIAYVQGQIWRVHRYRLKEWGNNVETLNEHQREDLVHTAFEESRKGTKTARKSRTRFTSAICPRPAGKDRRYGMNTSCWNESQASLNASAAGGPSANGTNRKPE